MNELYAAWRERVRLRPDAEALSCGEERLSRQQFLALIDTTAAQLRREGLGAGALIGWLGLNSPQTLAMLLACARLGAVWVPLNWRLTASELAAIAEHAGLSALKSDPVMQGLADEVRALCPPRGPHEATQPGDALLVYTSGTTGRPKGAMHSHAGMLANAAAAVATQGLRESDRVLAVLPLFHVGGLCIQTLPALLAGAAVRLQPRFDPGLWLREVAQWRASTSLLVPAVMRALIAHADFADTDLSSLRFLNSGSSVVPAALIQVFHARGVPVSQVYGSTETGPVSIALHPDLALAHVGRTGRPAPGVELRLVHAQGRPAAPGEVGEIRLRGANLMRGYHRDSAHPDFVDGWFASGDLARLDEHGLCEVVGRSKDMIISGGENIYPAEIENLVAGWPGVADAVVLGLPDARWGEVPVLVLVAEPGATTDLAALQRLFDARLARFKHPRRIVWRDALPRTALGKVMKGELAAQLRHADAV